MPSEKVASRALSTYTKARPSGNSNPVSDAARTHTKKFAGGGEPHSGNRIRREMFRAMTIVPERTVEPAGAGMQATAAASWAPEPTVRRRGADRRRRIRLVHVADSIVLAATVIGSYVLSPTGSQPPAGCRRPRSHLVPSSPAGSSHCDWAEPLGPQSLDRAPASTSVWCSPLSRPL